MKNSKILNESGEWKLIEYIVSKEDEERQKNSSSFWRTRRYVPQGKYLKLTRNGIVVMSNTPDELRDFNSFIQEVENVARQRRDGIYVLIAGLGLGCVLDAVLEIEGVEHITVVEKSEDVLRLTGKKYLDNERVCLRQGDIFEIQKLPELEYEFGWFDIWDYITLDNLPEFTKLRRKFGKRVEFKRFWAERECKSMKSKDKDTGIYSAYTDTLNKGKK